jgi:uncharacterized RDD family membrane protein YckC
MALSNSTPAQYPSDDVYVLVVQGKPQGPYSIGQLKELKLKPGDFVKTAAMDDYKEAHEIPALRVLFGFKAQPIIPQYFGSFDQRLTASAIDLLFVSGAFIVVAFSSFLFIHNDDNRRIIGLSLLVIIPLTNLLYHIIMESSASQATYGKQILKIKVCDMEGERISFSRSAGRNFAKVFSAATFFIGYLICFFTKQQQCLHDMIAGTLVMKDRLI